MYLDKKNKALAAWLQFAREPEIQMSVEEQYDNLLKMADVMEGQGLITGAEWRQLIRYAGAILDRADGKSEGGPFEIRHSEDVIDLRALDCEDPKTGAFFRSGGSE